MIKLNFSSLPAELAAGTKEIKKELGFRTGGGTDISVSQKDGSNVIVSLSDGSARIVYDKKHHFFRALGLLVEALKDGKKEFYSDEKPYFTMNGPMFDVSQGNAVINVESAKKTFRQMALMGLNMFMFYCEDSFEVPEQPYFGYMRSRYTESDMRALDDYAYNLGIELIPCIQTLAHLTDPLRWRGVFDPIREDEDCLLVGEERTYKFIRDLITAATKPFRTKRIHIGMDEAWKLGRGTYLTKHGYVKLGEIMKIHLEKVMEIVRSLGLEPMMWSDMIYKSIYGNYSFSSLDDREIPKDLLDSVPKDITLVYWNYGLLKEENYVKMIRAHQKIGRTIFAGGIWTWLGFGPHWVRTFATSNCALKTCKKLGIKEVFVTIWGDNGTEAPFNVNMPGLVLYAEHGYAEDPDEKKIKKRFEFCTGANYDDFMELEKMDFVPGVDRLENTSYNPSKYLLWQDVLTGMFDKNIEGLPLDGHYAALADRLSEAIGRNGAYDEMFRLYRNAARTLAMKAQMGLRITEAYEKGNKKALRKFADNELPELKTRMASMRECHRDLWFRLYKPLGWDIMDMRYGSLISRIDSAANEINDYLGGKLKRIEELEEKRLPYNGEDGLIKWTNYFGRIVSPSRIDPH